jgi:hypothetical protein
VFDDGGDSKQREKRRVVFAWVMREGRDEGTHISDAYRLLFHLFLCWMRGCGDNMEPTVEQILRGKQQIDVFRVDDDMIHTRIGRQYNIPHASLG